MNIHRQWSMGNLFAWESQLRDSSAIHVFPPDIVGFFFYRFLPGWFRSSSTGVASLCYAHTPAAFGRSGFCSTWRGKNSNVKRQERANKQTNKQKKSKNDAFLTGNEKTNCELSVMMPLFKAACYT